MPRRFSPDTDRDPFPGRYRRHGRPDDHHDHEHHEHDHEHGPRGHRAGRRGPGGPGGAGSRGRGGFRGRAQRGDVRTATLLLLAESAMHGYQLMQAMSERTGGSWRPSPGAIYPTIAQLEDEGLVTITREGGRKLVTLTDTGRAFLADHGDELPDPFAEQIPSGDPVRDLRGPLEELHGAARQLARSGNDTQLAAAQKVLVEARRSLYLILAEDSGALGTS